jgi:hypothetical protein
MNNLVPASIFENQIVFAQRPVGRSPAPSMTGDSPSFALCWARFPERSSFDSCGAFDLNIKATDALKSLAPFAPVGAPTLAGVFALRTPCGLAATAAHLNMEA